MKKNFFIILVALLLLIAFTVSSVVKYNSLLSEKTLYTVAGTQENYGFSVAKFIIQLNELYTLINSDNTIDDVRLKFDILYSRLNVIYVKSEATAPLYKQQGYEETINSINKKLEEIDGLLSHNHPNYKKISTIIADIKPLTKTVTNLADMKIATVKPYVNVLKKKYFYSYGNGNKLTNFTQLKNNLNKPEKIIDDKADE